MPDLSKRRAWFYVAISLVAAAGAAAVYRTGPLRARANEWLARRDLRKHGGIRLVYAMELDRAVDDQLALYAQRLQADGPAFTIARSADGDVALNFADAAAAGALDGKRLDAIAAGLATLTRDGAAAHLRATPALRGAIARDAGLVVARRLARLGVRAPAPTVDGAQLTVELPALAPELLDRARRLLERASHLQFRLVDDGSDYMKRAGSALTAFKADWPDVEVETDEWTSFSHDTRHQDVYLRAADRAALERAFAVATPPPDGRAIAYQRYTTERASGWRSYYLYSSPILSGSFITEADVADDSQTGRPYVSVTLDRDGARLFEEATAKNVGRKLTIELDDRVMSAPVIESRIAGGHASITMGGEGDREQLEADARDLAIVLQAGALPARLTLQTEDLIRAE